MKRVLIAILLSVLVCGGCGEPTASSTDPPPAADAPRRMVESSGPAPVAQTASVTLYTTPAYRCAAPYAQPGSIEATPEVSRAVRSILLCVTLDGTRSRVENISSTLVWNIDRPLALKRDGTGPTPGLRVSMFRAVLPSDAALTLEPGEAVTIDHAPNEIHLFTDEDTQAAWETVTGMVDEAVDTGSDAAIRLLSRGSPERNAVLTCGWNAYAVTKDTWVAASDPALELNDALGLGADALGSSAECASEIKEAQQTRSRSRERPTFQLASTVRRFNSPVAVEESSVALRVAKQIGRRVVLHR